MSSASAASASVTALPPPPSVLHYAADGTKVSRPSLTPAQHHVRVLAQLPITTLLEEADATPAAEAAPAAAEAAPVTTAAAAAARPPPPEVMHRLLAARAEAEMVAMLARALLAGKQLRPGQVQPKGVAKQPSSERAFHKRRQVLAAASELESSVSRLRLRLGRERRVFSQAQRLAPHWQLLEVQPGQPSVHAAEAAALPALRYHLGPASAAAAAALSGSQGAAAAADGGIVVLQPGAEGRLEIASARGAERALQVVAVREGSSATTALPSWIAGAVGAVDATTAAAVGAAAAGDDEERMEVDGDAGGDADAALVALHASLLEAQFSRRGRALFTTASAAASRTAAAGGGGGGAAAAADAPELFLGTSDRLLLACPPARGGLVALELTGEAPAGGGAGGEGGASLAMEVGLMAAWRDHRLRLASAEAAAVQLGGGGGGGGATDGSALLTWLGRATTHAAAVRAVSARLDALAAAWRHGPSLQLHWRFLPSSGGGAPAVVRIDAQIVCPRPGGAHVVAAAFGITLRSATAHVALSGGAGAHPALLRCAMPSLLAGGGTISCSDGGEALAAMLHGVLCRVRDAGRGW